MPPSTTKKDDASIFLGVRITKGRGEELASWQVVQLQKLQRQRHIIVSKVSPWTMTRTSCTTCTCLFSGIVPSLRSGSKKRSTSSLVHGGATVTYSRKSLMKLPEFVNLLPHPSSTKKMFDAPVFLGCGIDAKRGYGGWLLRQRKWTNALVTDEQGGWTWLSFFCRSGS